jgi:predicted dehydrogenase
MFLSAIEQGADNESDFLDGLRCQKVIDAVARAKSEKRWITL